MLNQIKQIHKQATIRKGVLYLRKVKGKDFERIAELWPGSINCKRIKGFVNINTDNCIVNIHKCTGTLTGNLTNVNLPLNYQS